MVLGYDDDGLNPPKILIQDINELDLPKIMKVLGKHNTEKQSYGNIEIYCSSLFFHDSFKERKWSILVKFGLLSDEILLKSTSPKTISNDGYSSLQKFTGVLGAFNCQGGGWCRKERKNRSFSEFSHPVTTKAAATDIEWRKGNNPIPIEGVESFAVYFFQAKKLVLTTPNEILEITREPFDFELLTVSPVTIFTKKAVGFAPIGLVNMLNSGGAIQLLEFVDEEDMVRVGVKGTGEMRVFSSEKPKACRINGGDVAFTYDEKMITIEVSWSETSKLSTIEYLF